MVYFTVLILIGVINTHGGVFTGTYSAQDLKSETLVACEAQRSKVIKEASAQTEVVLISQCASDEDTLVFKPYYSNNPAQSTTKPKSRPSA